ncbi:MAG: helix-turn-helix transcriptional regulator, partial [Firmicutes bacterium]|nr:helix-turn-helix transcriptional regulator [Candidatus Onthovivens merdipullorum]
MPKTNLQTSILKEKRRVLIMEKALKLFATYGVDNITIDDIADSLKISHGLFYHYFKDKN